MTDVRYFAAMGVDWIGFNMKPESKLTIEHVVAFADWVSGPKFFLDVRGRSSDQIAAMLGDFQADGLLIDKEIALPHYTGKVISADEHGDVHYAPVDMSIYKYEKWQECKTNNNPDAAEEIWVQVADQSEYQHLTRETSVISGVVLEGGVEQKVGIKSYEDLDDLIELIRG